MKDRGVEWIGEVPEGWRPITLKRLFVSRVAGSWGEDENTNSMNSICLRIADFNYNTLSFKIKEDYTIRSYSSAEVEKKHLHGGDVLIEKSGGGEKTPVGRCVLYDLDLDKPMYANFMEKLSCRSFVNPKYIVYLMSSLYSAGVVWPYIKATTGIQNLDITSLLSREVVFIPSLREQEQIVELLKDRTRLLLNAIESCYNQLSLLQERKQIVINEVVTGKGKVV
jgi:type I restriction enzyme S subunit